MQERKTSEETNKPTKTAEELRDLLVRQMKEDLGAEWEVTPKDVMKNNHVEFHGVRMEYLPTHFQFVAYAEEFENAYNRDAADMQEISDTIRCFIGHCPYKEKEAAKLQEQAKVFGDVRDRIMAGLVNYEANREELKDRPHLKWLDLAIIFYLDPEVFYAEGFPIDNGQIEKWNVTTDELLQAAFQNMLKKDRLTIRMVTCSGSYFYDYPDGNRYIAFRDAEETKEPTVIVSSTYNKAYGATCLLSYSLLSNLAEKLEEDLFIYPKSIDEVVISPAEPNEAVRKMIAEEIPEDASTLMEKLSNSIYHFDRVTGKVSISKLGEPLR